MFASPLRYLAMCEVLSQVTLQPRTALIAFQTLNFLGSSLSMSALLACPSKISSDINNPVAGPFWIPQQVCPAAIHRPGVEVWPISGPLSSPNRTC